MLRIHVLDVALVVSALACRADTPEAHAPDSSSRTISPETAVSDAVSDSLRLELLLPRSARAGEPISIRLRVENRTQHRIDLYLRGRTPTFDVIVARSDGVVVWHRLEDEVIPAIVSFRALAPGDHLELAATWNQRTKKRQTVGAGSYTARGLLLVEGSPLETPRVPFVITKR